VAKTRYANISRITMNAFVPVGACANFGSETAGTYAPASLCTGEPDIQQSCLDLKLRQSVPD